MTRLILVLSAALTVAAATPIQPGKWVTTVTILDVAMPGTPPQVAAAIKGHPTTVSACVTPADAAKGPRAAIEKTNGRCRYTDYTMSGGRISSTMVCSQPGGAMTVHAIGSYTPTSVSVEGTGMMTGARAMTIHTRTVGRRVGGC